jgi:predicted flavoprotein YhiN
MNLLPRIVLCLLAVCLTLPARAAVREVDVLVFGATAGGVSAACTAARFGKSVIVTEFGRHVGGLTSGGLGWTDIGNKAAIGGFSRDFYKRLGKHYGKP